VNITDNGLKALILAAGVLITCLVLSIGFNFSNESQAISASSTEQLVDFANELSDSDIKMYDGLDVTGSDVVNFIKRELSDYSSSEIAPVYVYVKTTNGENTYYNGEYISNIQNFTTTKYIKPTSKFIGDIVRDANEVIIGVKFIQK
jgi:hypothetical protein